MQVACFYRSGDWPKQEFAEACLRWTSQVAIGDEAVFLEIGRSRLVVSPQRVESGLRSLAKRFFPSSPDGAVALAEDPPTAIARARFGLKEKKDLPIEAIMDYGQPFGKSEAGKGEIGLSKMAMILRDLGVVTLGEFLKIHPRELASRFGKEGLLVSLRIRQSVPIPWPPFQPVEIMREVLDLSVDSPVSLEPIIFAAKKLLDRLEARLRGRAESVQVWRLKLVQEKNSLVRQPQRDWLFDLSRPQSTARSLLLILRERLSRDLEKEPLEAPIISMVIEYLRCVPRTGGQKNFFDKREEEKEKWESLVGRLEERLGKGRVFQVAAVANYRPEQSWRKTLEANRAVNHSPWVKDPTPPRPLRMLQRPQPLYQEGSILIGPGRRWQVVEMDGPEQISGNWWKGPFVRDYYRVMTTSGEELWVYREEDMPSQKGSLFLHGWYD